MIYYNHILEKNLELHYMNIENLRLSVNNKDIIKDLKNLEDMFDFSNLDKNDELSVIKTESNW